MGVDFHEQLLGKCVLEWYMTYIMTYAFKYAPNKMLSYSTNKSNHSLVAFPLSMSFPSKYVRIDAK